MKVAENSNILVLTGPESCGKTTLATMLSDACRAPLVHEVSRDYLSQRISRDSHFQYSESDLLEIASKQFNAEEFALAKSPALLVCDTDLLVLIVWSEVRFGRCHDWILDAFSEAVTRGRRHYLLCHHDIPWEADPLREHADSRGELFELYRQKLEFYNLPYSILNGDRQQRLDSAVGIIDGLDRSA